MRKGNEYARTEFISRRDLVRLIDEDGYSSVSQASIKDSQLIVEYPSRY